MAPCSCALSCAHGKTGLGVLPNPPEACLGPMANGPANTAPPRQFPGDGGKEHWVTDELMENRTRRSPRPLILHCPCEPSHARLRATKRATRCCSSFFLPWRWPPETVRGRAGWVRRSVRRMDAAAKPGMDSRRLPRTQPARPLLLRDRPTCHEGLSRWPESCAAQIRSRSADPWQTHRYRSPASRWPSDRPPGLLRTSPHRSGAPPRHRRHRPPACAAARGRRPASSRSGEMVRRSQPASASICAVERNEAPITTVFEPRRLNSA